MLVVGLFVVTLISIAALAISLVCWSRLPRQAPRPAPPGHPAQAWPGNPFPPATPGHPAQAWPGNPYPPAPPAAPPMTWLPRSPNHCVDSTD